jgi:FMN reductase
MTVEDRYVEQAPLKPRLLVIGASLNPNSASYRLAEAAVDAAGRAGAEATLLDLRKWDLPLCDGDASYSHPAVEKISRVIQNADAILLAAPIYNYDVNAAAKNLIELTGDAWSEKPVGFLCAAGGKSSYMSPIGLANSLMFDFRSWIVPRFVYATRADFDSGGGPSAQIVERIEQLTASAVDMARALAWARNAREAAAVSGPSTQT